MLVEQLALPRTLKLTVPLMRGLDVEAHTRAMHRALVDGQLIAFNRQRPVVKETFGIGKRDLTKKVQKAYNIRSSGVFGRVTYWHLVGVGAYDAKANDLLAQYVESLEPKVVPVHGLTPALWELYAIGTDEYKLRDGPGTASGTYNPASRLPGGGPSSHAVFPAQAFDLDIVVHTGWANANARAFFYECMRHPKCGYVILGDRIWTRRRASEGVRHYSAGGHDNHIHVNGLV